VVRNLRRVSHVNLLVNFKTKQYCGCCLLKYFLLLHMSKCQDSRFNYCILACPLGKPYHAPIHKTSKNKQKTEYMIVGSRQWLCNIIDDRKIELGQQLNESSNILHYTKCHKKPNYWNNVLLEFKCLSTLLNSQVHKWHK
jgi:hypothetical protein